MSLFKINACLRKTINDLGIGLPIAFENENFTPPVGEPWAAVFIIPNQPSVATLGDAGDDEHDGIVQIDLNYPTHQGTGLCLQKADFIRENYSAGKRFELEGQEIGITSCGRSSGRQIDGVYTISLTISWWAYTRRSIQNGRR